MDLAFLTALGVGGATVVGAILGFMIKGVSQRFSNTVMAFAAGVMLAAAIPGLILPSLTYGGRYGTAEVIAGIFAGALFMRFLGRAVPHMTGLLRSGTGTGDDPELCKVLLLVSAIAIHNLPEGIAAGVGFGGEDTARAMMIAGGIALHNIPEGMVVIAPMLAAGVTPKRTFICAMATGLAEVAGTLIGFASVTVSAGILPFALAFAGGTMLYVICDEMIPETKGSVLALMVGFAVMIVTDTLI